MKAKLLYILIFFVWSKGYSQMQVIKVNDAAGDNPNLLLRNDNAAGYTNDLRASIWLDNDGRLKLRSVTGNGSAFRNTQNTADIINITDIGMGIYTNYIPEGYRFAINGSGIATSLTVKLRENWPDYVFKKGYQLPALSEIKLYIQKNRHLPEMPTAEDIAKDGLNLGETNKLLVKKVEELTLYLIQLKEENGDLIKEMDERFKIIESKLKSNLSKK